MPEIMLLLKDSRGENGLGGLVAIFVTSIILLLKDGVDEIRLGAL